MDGYIKIEQIADDLNEHPLLRDIPFDRIINDAVELIRVVGSPKLFTDRTAVVKIDKYRGVLPCDFSSIIQVRGLDGSEYVPTMDNFHVSPHKPEYVGLSSYKIQGRIIITSNERCDIEIAYRSMPVDENGWPMIPDDAEFVRALEAYIKYKKFKIYFDTGKISQNVYINARDDYNNLILSAQTHMITPTPDEMETIANMWHSLIPRVSNHRDGFAAAHNRQYIKRH